MPTSNVRTVQRFAALASLAVCVILLADIAWQQHEQSRRLAALERNAVESRNAAMSDLETEVEEGS